MENQYSITGKPSKMMMIEPNMNILGIEPYNIPLKYNLEKDGYSLLDSLKGIYIKQEFDSFKALTGCNSENIYHVHDIDFDGNPKTKSYFKGQEKSNFLTRFCLP